MNEVIVARGIHKKYFLRSETVHVLRGIDVTVQRGEFLVVLGPSGSGKSTLLNILGTLDDPTEGDLSFDGTAASRFSDRELSVLRNRAMGFVFQFHHLLSEFTVLENVALPGYVKGERRDRVQERARTILERFGLGRLHGRLPDEISGGERQRVAVARALINDPLVVLADEPTGNLDAENAGKLIQMLVGLKDEGKAVIVVTHSLEIARRGTAVFSLKEGRLYAV